MFGLSKKTAIKATVAALLSMVVSVSVALICVPMLGGHPDGPGFWMSVVCPLIIAWPASAFQFSQKEKITAARDELRAVHEELAKTHAELAVAHAALQQKARIDGLTGTLNRETFLAQLEAAADRDRACALMIADADHFKQINDEFGHQAGDEALRAITRAIGACLRQRDFFGRIGGEEFAIFLDGADPETAVMTADMIRLAVSAIQLRVNTHPVPVSISIGISHSNGRFEPKTLFSDADRRLYSAKNNGRNRVVYEDDDEESVA